VRRLPRAAMNSLTAAAALACGLVACGLGAQAIERQRATATPIEHLIVVVGENISFDNLFATYEPPPGETVSNLLSRGIVDRDGNPGPHFADAAQREASVRERYLVIPPSTRAAQAAAAGNDLRERAAAKCSRCTVSGRAVERTVPDHALRRPQRACRRSGASLFPDVAASRRRQA
jgi:phospholipase C